jgi:hypothetical protein
VTPVPDPEESDDAWPDEPDEFDPTSLGPDPPNQEAGVSESPGEDTIEDLAPEPPSIEGGDLDPEANRMFWGLVLVFNVALLALAAGPMMIAFQGWWDAGIQVTAVGVLAFAYGSIRYYTFRRDRDWDVDDGDGDDEGDGGANATETGGDEDGGRRPE